MLYNYFENSDGVHMYNCEADGKDIIDKTVGRKRMTKSGKTILIVLISLAVVAAGLLTFYFIDSAQKQEEEAERQTQVLSAITDSSAMHPGITIDGIDVGGMSIEQAQEALEARKAELLNAATLTVTYDGNSFPLDSNYLEITYDYASAIEQAMGTARTGDYATLTAEVQQIESQGLDFEVPYTITATNVSEFANSISASVDVPAVDAQIEMSDEGDNGFIITQSSPGLVTDSAALATLIDTALASGDYATPIQLPVTESMPAVSTEDLSANLVLRAEAESSFADSPYNRDTRVENVKMAADFVNGTIIMPGEEFSTNDVLGDRTYELGWQPAPAYTGGTTEDQAGGGVCQVSSTLYNAVVKPDLEIVYRRNHSMTVGYVPRGLDATINTGTIDFLWKNNTEHPILVIAYTTSDQDMVVEIYGEDLANEEYDEIRLSSEKVSDIAPDGDWEITVDNTKPAGYEEVVIERRDGMLYQSYKHYYLDGEEVRVEELAESQYRAYNGEKIVGPSVPTYNNSGVIPGGSGGGAVPGIVTP